MSRLFAPRTKASETPAVVDAPPPPPATLSKAEVQELLAGVVGGLNETVATLGRQVQELATRQPQVIVQPPAAGPAQPANISDQEIDNALLMGNGAAAIRAMVDREVNRKIEQRVRPLEEYGVNTIGEISRRVVTGGMKHYPRYKKEIEAQLQTLTPDVRANPVVIETIYNAVVGLHSDELSREAAEAAVRQAQEPMVDDTVKGKGRGATPGTGAGSAGGAREHAAVPDMGEFLGSHAEEGVEALQHKGNGGQDQDSFARSMGYDSWSTYMKQYKELQASEMAH